nr:hypothetical protein [Tanacetum cinerariifolium]
MGLRNEGSTWVFVLLKEGDTVKIGSSHLNELQWVPINTFSDIYTVKQGENKNQDEKDNTCSLDDDMEGLEFLRQEHPIDEFPLPEQLSTANEDKFPLLIQSDATAEELYATAEVKDATITLSNKVEDPISGNIKWYQSLVRSFDLQKNKIQSTSFSLSIFLYTQKWINKTLPLPKFQSWTQENLNNGNSGYSSISNMNTMPYGSKYKTAQELWAAILKTFGGNEATKKTKKNLLKQQCGNFKAEGSETMKQTFNRLQAIVTKSNSGNEEVNTASIPTASTYVSPASANIGAASINQDTACAYIALQSNGKKISIQGTDVAGFDKSKVKCFNCHKMGHFARECRALRSQDSGRRDNYRQGSKVEEQAPKALMAIDRVGWDWSFMANEEENHALVADEEDPAEFALMAKTSAECEVFDNSLCSKTCKKNTDSLKNDTVTDYSRPSHAIESTSDDLQNRNPSVTETGASPSNIVSKPFIKFVKATDSPTENKADKVETVKKPTVKYAKLYRKPSKKSNNSTAKGLNNNYVSVILKKYQYIDTQGRLNGCSRHMTGNISYLSDYEPFDEGYMSFGQGGCKITGKGTIKTGKLEFENVYFVKDLKYNLFSVSQIYDNKNSVLFTDSECIMLGRDFKLIDDTNVLLRTPRQHNMYSIDLNNIVPYKDLTCLVAKASADECMLWHRRHGHLNFKTMNKMVRHNLVRGLPTKCFENDHTCTACLKGKQHKASCKTKLVNSVTKPLHTLHMDLFGPTSDETSGILRNFITEIENLKDLKVKIIRTLIEAARTMLADAKLRVTFWAEAVNTACYVQNRGSLKQKGVKVILLGTLCLAKHLGYNMRTKRVEENLHVDFLENKAIEKGTKDATSQEVKKDVSSLRYIALPNWVYDKLLESSSSNAQDTCKADTPESDSPEPSSTTRIILKRVTSQDVTPSLENISTLANRFDDILGVTTSTVDSHEEEADVSIMETTITASLTPTLRIHKDHPKKPKKISDALKDPSWMEAMQEELLQFKIQNVWTLVDCPEGVRPIGTKWVLKNKKDERGIVTRNKARLVAQGHTQEEGIDYKEVFAPVARIEAIRLFLAYASFMGFTVYQMDVKSAFLYGTIDEEVYVMQPPRFYDLQFPAKVYKVEKAMYGLHQAPRAWHRGYFLLVKVYVDDIIFGSSNPLLCREFEALMHENFQMSAMGELNFFLGLQVTQKEDGIFLSQDKYVGDILKKFGYTDVRSANTPMDKENPSGKDGSSKDVELHLYRSRIGSLMYLIASRPNIMFAVCACARHQVTPKECNLHAVKKIFRYLKVHPKLSLWYPKESPFDLVAYSDSDYGGAAQDRKSTTGGCQFLGRRLISWQCKKQIIVATSITEVEYVAAASSCRQVLHLFIRDCFEKKLISMDHIHTDENVADLLTKPFDAGRFQYLVDRNNGRGNQDSRYRRRSLPDAKLFENLTLMGYNISPNQKFTFQKGQFSHQWKYLIHTIMQCLSPKSIGFNEFNSNIATALVCLATNRVYNFSKMIFDGMVKNINNKVSKFLMYPRQYTRRTRIAQSSALQTAADKPASPIEDGSQEEACPTVSGLESGQDKANIIKTSTLPHKSTSRVTSLAADEGNRGVAEQSGDDAPIKGRSLESREETGAERTKKGSNDTEEMVNVLTSLDAAIVLSSGVFGISTGAEISVAEVPTSSGSVPTASPIVPTGSDVVPTASPIFTTATVATPYIRRKGKEKMVESDTPKKKKLQEQIDVQTQQRKPLSRKQQKKFYMSVLKTHAEESKRFKRKGIRLEQDSAKKLKTSEEVPEEKLKEMMELIPVEEVYVEDLNQLWGLVKKTLNIRPASSDKEKELWVELKRLYEPDVEDQLWSHTQNMMHAPVEWKLYDTCGVHHVISKYQEMFILVEKDNPLRKGLAIVMICYKLQVENYSQMANELNSEDIQDCQYLGEDCWEYNEQGIPTSSDEFPLPEQLPTANEDKFPLLIQSDATAEELCATAEVKE